MSKADGLLSFRVSDAVRRRKVDGARTRGPHSDGLWGFRLWVVFAGGRRRQYVDGFKSGPSAFWAASRLSGCGRSDFEKDKSAFAPMRRGVLRCPVHGRNGGDRRYAVPDHDAKLPDTRTTAGGARGWYRRSKVSMMTIRPPQHGHGGRVSDCSAGVSSVARGATASNCRARRRLSLRELLASRP